MDEEVNIFLSRYVPKQEKISEDEKAQLLEKFKIKLRHLPKIRDDDPVVKRLNAKSGDVIKVTRISTETGTYNYYRVVV